MTSCRQCPAVWPGDHYIDCLTVKDAQLIERAIGCSLGTHAIALASDLRYESLSARWVRGAP